MKTSASAHVLVLAVCPRLKRASTITAAANAQVGGEGNVTVLQGCADTKCGSIDAGAIKAAAGAPTVKAIVLAMGIDSAIEGEGHSKALEKPRCPSLQSPAALQSVGA